MASHRKASVGDPLAIQATEFNGWQRAAAFVDTLDRSYRRSPLLSLRDSGVVLVRNDSGSARDQLDILCIDGVVIRRSDNEAAFLERITLKGVTPTWELRGKFAVLLEPLGVGKLGRAVMSNLVQVRVSMTDEDDRYADSYSGAHAALVSAPCGAAELLHVEPADERDDPAIAMCIARLAPADTLCEVEITDDDSGGSFPKAYKARRINGSATVSGARDLVNRAEERFGNEIAGSWEPFKVGDVVWARWDEFNHTFVHFDERLNDAEDC